MCLCNRNVCTSVLLINWSINIIHIKFLCCCSSNANNRQASDWSKIRIYVPCCDMASRWWTLMGCGSLAGGLTTWGGCVKVNRAQSQILLLCSWKCFPNSACSRWLLQGHMTSNNETVSHQNLWAGNIAKSMMSEGNSALLPTNVDWRPTFHWGLMNF